MGVVDPEKVFFHNLFIYYLPKGNQPARINIVDHVTRETSSHQGAECEIYNKREWLNWTLKEKSKHWTEPYIADDEPDMPTLVTFSVPFKVNNGSPDIDGVLGLTIDLNSLQKYFKEIKFKGSGKALLLSKKGLYISHPDPEIVMHKTIFQLAKETGLKELEFIGNKMAKGQSGMVDMEKSTIVKGDSVLVFYAPIPNLDWGVCLVFSKHDFFAKMRTLNLKLLLSSGLTLLILSFAVTKLSRDISRSLKKLADVAQEYGSGNFNAKFPNLYGKDEIGRLASAFRKMKDNLITYIDREKQVYAFEQKLSVEMETASRIQRSILPRTFPADHRFSISALMHPAKEVGGDFYDCFYLGKDRYAISVADVSGKGIPASLFMMMSKGLIKTIATTSSGLSLADVFNKVNSTLCENNEAEMFITVFMAVINLRDGTVEYVNAGHNPPLLKHKGSYDFINPMRNLALAVMDTTRYRTGSFKMEPGDRIFIYTDGVTEAQNMKNEFFGNERLKQTLNSEPVNTDSAGTLETVRKQLHQFSGGAPQADDITMLELSYMGDLQEMQTPENTPEAKNVKNEPDGSRQEKGNSAEQDKTVLSEKRNFKASIDEWDNISAFLEQKSEAAGLTQPRTMKLLISAEEIFSNIARYAYEEPGNADITVTIEDGMLKVIFEDTGIAYNPLEKDDPDITLPAEERKIGGLGIFIVKKSMDLVRYERKDNKNIFTMGLKL
jgi:sigma-B regulation protein RsbU (phosphoserine phosphatase)